MFDYPKYQKHRVGIKVSWYYYANEEDAKKASAVAVQEAQVQMGRGYDFGYCAPGSIALIDKGPFAGLYEVCIP